jgi:broad specificity phosphatase PhoE
MGDRRAAFLKMVADLNARHLIGVDEVREVWLIRHADAYTGMQEMVDPPLSAFGRAQAARLSERLAGVPLDAVWSSPMRRARETADAIVRDRPLQVRVEPRLREVRTHWDDGREDRIEPGAYPFPEPEAEVLERMAAALVDVVAALDPAAAPVPRAVVVSHYAAIALYVARALGLGWREFRMMPTFTSVTVIAVRGDQVVVRSIGDATHLVGLALPD